MSVSLSIVEDKADFQESLLHMLSKAPGYRCLHTYSAAEDALRGIPVAPPDVVLMDINLPGMSGVECVRRLHVLAPQVRVIMLTVYDNTENIYAALKAGASGYLLKRTSPAKLLEAIQDVVDGGAPMSSAIARKVVQSFQDTAPAAGKWENLSSREQEVLEMLAKGYLYKEISDQLHLGLGTIKTYIRRIYEKLHVQSRTEAVLKYLGQENSNSGNKL
ncbi:MAG TPA: response regulator transcription factor [Verrucomicrobiae bacterium]|nr:response regulator transcription factor [Verrucomicrobiae bacterium]